MVGTSERCTGKRQETSPKNTKAMNTAMTIENTARKWGLIKHDGLQKDAVLRQG